jgi:CRISPR-associated endonuclease/helicase Cas3
MNLESELIAHRRESDGKTQTLWEHLLGVSERTAEFADIVGLKVAGALIGLVHDLGKASDEFQQYIKSATKLIDQDKDDYVDSSTMKGRIDHSSAGAQWIYSNLKKEPISQMAGQFLALCVASHHSGLIDCLSPEGDDVFSRRMMKDEDRTHLLEAFSKLNADQQATLQKLISDERLCQSIESSLKSLREEIDTQDTLLFKCGLLIRFMYSCLVDADRLDSAEFEQPEEKHIRQYGEYKIWDKLISRLNNKVEEFENKTDKNQVDVLRNRVSQNCLEFAKKPKGIFQLSVPTGGGKTFSSLRFALNHAQTHHMARIFYVIPYTSIIDQNAEEVRKILEDRDEKGQLLDRIVLEHHSNLTPEEETYRNKILSQNWDAPVVFTTQVQFLESLFGHGTRNARRMHQLANSVIIFDEIQCLPIKCIHMFNVAIRFLVKTCGCSVVLSTATQPLLDDVSIKERSLTILPENKIITYEKELFSALKRTNVIDRRKPGGWEIEEIEDLALSEQNSSGSVLIVVNTRRSARLLFETLNKQKPGIVYHLSTGMCPAHRLDNLAEIRQKLEDKEPVICVSTQLIEAGVDVDFGAVIRYLAGLDSIAQAAGRCNRNGRRPVGTVWIINPADESLDRLADIRIGAEKTLKVLDEFNIDPDRYDHDRISIELIREYYRNYFYERQGLMNYPVSAQSFIGRDDNLFNVLSENSISIQNWILKSLSSQPPVFKHSFNSASRVFNVIETVTKGVIVPYGERGNKIITKLCGHLFGNSQYRLLREAQHYSVNLYDREFSLLSKLGAIREVKPESGIYHLDKQYYNKDFGWSEDFTSSMSLLSY